MSSQEPTTKSPSPVLDPLLAQGIRVPDECAVVGFDDSAQAEPAQLTSYSVNAPTVVLEAIRFGQNPPDKPSPCRELVVDGYVVKRRTGQEEHAASSGAVATAAGRSTSPANALPLLSVSDSGSASRSRLGKRR
jgi:hypothetical protein